MNEYIRKIEKETKEELKKIFNCKLYKDILVPAGWHSPMNYSNNDFVDIFYKDERIAKYGFSISNMLQDKLVVMEHIFYHYDFEYLPEINIDWIFESQVSDYCLYNLKKLKSLKYSPSIINKGDMIINNCNPNLIYEPLPKGRALIIKNSKNVKINIDNKCKIFHGIDSSFDELDFSKSDNKFYTIEFINSTYNKLILPEKCNILSIKNINSKTLDLDMKKCEDFRIEDNTLEYLISSPKECDEIQIISNSLRSLINFPKKIKNRYNEFDIKTKLPKWYIKGCLDMMVDGNFNVENHNEFLINSIKKNPKLIENLENLELPIEVKNNLSHILKSEEYGLFENENQELLNQELLISCKNNEIEKVKILLSKGADIETRDNIKGMTPLILSSNNNNLELVKLLVRKGCNIDSKDNSNNTPLIASAIKGNLEIFKFLIERGANINIKNKGGKTVLTIAEYYRHFNILKYLKTYISISSVLGHNYPYYKKSRKEQIIDSIDFNPLIINYLDKDELKEIPEIQHLIKSDEYGLFEKRIMNFNQFKNKSS